MTEIFEANNGVRFDEDGYWVGGAFTGNLADIHEARKEFYRDARDKELGLLRSKKHPDYVALFVDPLPVNGSTPKGRGLNIRHEGKTKYYTRWEEGTDVSRSRDTDVYDEVAEELFAANPEPKPWLDAERGEVWDISISERTPTRVMTVNVSGTSYFVSGGFDVYALDYPRITSGKRLKIEGEDD